MRNILEKDKNHANYSHDIRHRKMISDLRKLESETDIVRRIRIMRKELLCNGAWSNKTTEEEEMKFEKVDVPQWERDIFHNSMDFTTKATHNILRKLDKFLDEFKDLIEEGK